MSTFKAGDLLMVTWGSYSDKSWGGPVRIVKDFDGATVAKEYEQAFRTQPLAVHPEPDAFDRYEMPDPDCSWDKPQSEHFLPFLVRSGYVEHVNCRQVSVGDCSFRPDGLSVPDAPAQ